MKPITLTTGVCGRFRLEKGKCDADGNPIPGTHEVVADWFNNLITNTGLDFLGSGVDPDALVFAYAHVGTSNTAPANSQNGMLGPVARSNATQTVTTTNGISDETGFYNKTIITIRFGEGEAEGNLQEVGMGPQDNNTTVASRALIVDGGGSPTTITILADEYLDVTYEHRHYLPETDVEDTLTLSDGDHDITIRASSQRSDGAGLNFQTQHKLICGAGFGRHVNQDNVRTVYQGDAALSAVGVAPTGTSFGNDLGTVTNVAYVSGDYYRDMTFSLGLSDANHASGVGLMVFANNRGNFAVLFDPPIAKTNVHVLAITLRWAWARKTL